MEKTKENYYRILIVSICFVFFFFARITPNIIWFQHFKLPWESRLFSIVSVILCFCIFKKHFSEYNFIKTNIEMKHLRITSLVSIITIVGYLFVFYFRGSPQKFNIEEFLFISTIVEIEEELFFRGILLGLLLSCLDKKIAFIKYPAAVLSGIIFGFWHGNFMQFDFMSIIVNCFFGYIMGWLAIKNKSIIMPIIVHILTNALGYLLQVILLK
jgi:membrane protease YdiL (CAAX protease family)